MKKSTRKNIGYKKERVVLSDILPYEVPPFFSNRYFYRFLLTNKICICNDELRFKKDSSNVLEKIIRIVFGIDKQINIEHSPDYSYFKLGKEQIFVTIPFKFKITHKNNKYRELSVIHPINQLQLVSFYDKYKYTILKNNSISRFSLRKPYKIASLKYFKDNTNKRKKSKTPEIEIIETSDKEYTSLKTFFTYKKYSNIYKFYESYEYQKAEKRFDNLLKFDISRCFDSIYTHSLSWALTNKKIIKDNLGGAYEIFGSQFDKLMRQLNYNETNGIVIGPEFSRIFAELILQKIDKNVEKELFQKGYRFKEHYDVYRYVDDYFIFYTDEKVKNEISDIYAVKLQEYNLSFNESKTQIINKPIITNITIAKEKIRKLIENSTIIQFYNDETQNQIGIKYNSAKDIITNYKVLLASTGTSYKDLQNYFLSIIFTKIKKLIKQFQEEQELLLNLCSIIKHSDEFPIVDDCEKERHQLKLVKIQEQEILVKKHYTQLYRNFNETIELTFFIYSVLPRVTYSIKVCHILFRIIDFIRNQEKTRQRYISKSPTVGMQEINYIAFDFDKKHIIYKKIYDGITAVFNRNNSFEYAEVETLYLLPIINELGKHYHFSEELLINHFNIVRKIGDNKDCVNYNINYFTIISILNHIKRDGKYNKLRDYLQTIISRKFTNFERFNAEDIFLLIDILTCPYIAINDIELKKFRKKILEDIKFFDNGLSDSNKNEIIDGIEKYHSNWFYKWKDNDLGLELNTKRGHNVY